MGGSELRWYMRQVCQLSKASTNSTSRMQPHTSAVSGSAGNLLYKQLLTCHVSCMRMFSAITMMPSSIDELPVWFTSATSVTSALS